MTQRGSYVVVKTIHLHPPLLPLDLSISFGFPRDDSLQFSHSSGKSFRIYLIKLSHNLLFCFIHHRHQHRTASSTKTIVRKLTQRLNASTRNAKLFQLKLLFLFRPTHPPASPRCTCQKFTKCFHVSISDNEKKLLAT